MTEKKLILCIDDEPDLISVTRLLLESKGYAVEGGIGGIQGLEKARQLVPDLILLDLMMPDMNGWEVYQHLKADTTLGEIPVILVTARDQSVDKTLGLEIAKVTDYIIKPFDPLDLIRRVDAVLK